MHVLAAFSLRNSSKLGQLARNDEGNFSLLTGLMLLPMAALVGTVMDVSYALNVKAEAQEAADAAVVEIINPTSDMMQTVAQATQDTSSASAEASKYFTASLRQSIRALNPQTVTNVSYDGTNLNAKLTFTMNVPTTIMQLMGFDHLTVSGSSVAQSLVGQNQDIFLFLDNSPSMGVAATQADINKMVAATPDQCAFACHELDTNNNYYTLAKSLGVSMRFDLVRAATSALADRITAVTTHPGQYRVSLFTLGSKAENAAATNVLAPTSDMNLVKTTASAIDIMTVPYQGYNNDQQTDLDAQLPNLRAMINSTASAIPRQKILFIISDGVADEYNPNTCFKPLSGARCQEPINPALCNQIKADGTKIAVLYTTYLPLPTNWWYNTFVGPYQSQIGSYMQTCASPGLYFQVDFNGSIPAALQTLFNMATSAPRVTS